MVKTMEIKKIKVGNSEFEFVNESGNTRYGFYHRSVLFCNGCKIGENRVNYLNRTWESYRYQTCMVGLIRDKIESRTNYLRKDFMCKNNYKKMTDKRKMEFANSNEFLNDEFLNEYTCILDSLKTSF